MQCSTLTFKVILCWKLPLSLSAKLNSAYTTDDINGSKKYFYHHFHQLCGCIYEQTRKDEVISCGPIWFINTHCPTSKSHLTRNMN